MKRLFILLVGLVMLCDVATAQLTEQQQIQKLNYVYSYIRNNYVEDVSLEPLVEEAIRATLKELDPHSNYLTKDEMTEARMRLRGELAGIGIRYVTHNDTVVIREVMDDSPAMRANIYPNDRIIAIDNRCIVGYDIDSVSTLLKGDPNSKVRLQISRRNNDEIIDITLKRDHISTSVINAAYRYEDVGYISVSSFSKRTATQFYEAYKELGDVKSLVIDLRDNGGGAMSAAIDLTSLFLKKGEVIVYQKYRDREEEHCNNAKKDGILSDIPIVVIINENSASASEIFAGAIQDHDRGVIAGHTSYGKGLVQRLVNLKDGSGFTMTIAHYKTPSGRIIQRPYNMGERDTYYNDATRYMHPDSIAHDDAPMFKTLKLRRTIYGGGGITPDIYFNAERIRLSDIVIGSAINGAFEHAIIDYWDSIDAEAIIKEYPTVKAFDRGYTIDPHLLDIFYRYAGYTQDETTNIDRTYIRTMLLATLAGQLYGSNASYYIHGINFDYMIRDAIDIANDEVIYREILEHR